ncbi:histidinol-phosphate transaminase [Aquincola sp. S2]|uniref:Histidinol-phosphate aminotransferase n=1 Tax=Pseudaquabacterium terrae TaxID=2732868 RepID=A0ABX2ETG0_9BURK|nr:histidinol-phosphate transaminase [Aquabacterium terrae]NRF71928.1 histidinol-phosphate transaminase [Aquabacterium terrae]
MNASLDTCMTRTIRSDIQGMHAYAVQPSAGMVKLDTMENPYRLPEHLQQALGERLGRIAINRYPAERTDDLRAALATHAGLPEGCALTLGNGSDELITMLSMACDLPGAAIMAPLPSFVMYGMSAALQGIRFIGVPLTADFELDEPAMLAAIETEKPTLLYLAYPNNPSANLWDDAVIDRLIEAVGRIDGLVVIDEAYQPFAARDSMNRLQRYPNVLVMRTMSKFGLAGVRIGYLMGRAPLIGQIDKLRPPFNISVLNAEAGLFALEHVDEYARQAAAIRSERERLLRELAELPGVHPFPSQANMILVRVPDSAAAFAGMKERGVLVKNLGRMHPLLVNCLRLTIGTPDENVQMMDALRASL